ncbi:substrate-binding domain-containing protein, partial [Pseudophaeobacter sp.]|uniref:substrate-binding domain-containing protein n=1 Tax=Pseudophaeobacter sp. TaxID=1971739 RepID=UPI00329A3101
DLSVIGFDGIEIGQLMVPSLATIATDPAAMGRAAARHLLARITNQKHTVPPLGGLGFEFRPGESLGPVRADMRSSSRAATPLLPLHHSKTA